MEQQRIKKALFFISILLNQHNSNSFSEESPPRASLSSTSTLSSSMSAKWLQPLKYEPLAKARPETTSDDDNDDDAPLSVPSSSMVDDGVSEVTQKLHDLLYSKEWLLEENQHFSFPNISGSIRDETKPIFSMADFVHQQEERLQNDVVMSSSNNKKNLSPLQYKELQQTGRLSVPSHYFQGQNHLWKIHPSFYSGTNTARNRFQIGFGRALDHIVVRTQDALVSSEGSQHRGPSLYRSVVNGFGKSFLHAGECLRDLFGGSPFKPLYNQDQIERIIMQAQFIYTRYHMNQIQPGYHNCGSSASADCYENASSQLKILKDNDVWKDYAKYIPDGDHTENKYRQIRHKINQHSEKVRHDMEVRRNDELGINETIVRESPLAAIKEKQRARQRWHDKVQQEIVRTLQSSEDVILQSEGNRLYAEEKNQKIIQDDDIAQQQLLDEFKQNLMKKRPILSLSPLWMKRRSDRYQLKLLNDQKQSRGGRLLKQLKMEHQSTKPSGDGDEKRNIDLVIAPLEFDARFREEEADEIQKALEKKRLKRSPAEVYILKLDSKKWFQDKHGKYRKVEVDRNRNAIIWRTQYFWYNFCALATQLGGSAFHFLTNGPLSIRALLSHTPFYAYQMRNRDGSMVDDPRSLTPTFVSRLQLFYHDLRQIRYNFEQEPDVGLVGKSIQRMFLRCYLGLKALVGTTAITSFMVFGSIITTAITSATLLLSPFLAGICTMAAAAFSVLIYDTTRPVPGWSPIVKMLVGFPYYIIVPGIGQFLMALGLGIMHPLIGMVLLSWSSLRFYWTSSRDAITWTLIRRHAKVPSGDTFLAKRIMGPGISSTYFYRLPKKQALLAIQAFLESYRLTAYGRFRLAEIMAPFKAFQSIINKVVHPVGFEATKISSGPEEVERRMFASRAFQDLKRGNEDLYQLTHFCKFDNTTRGRFWDDLATRIRSAHPTYASKLQFQSKKEVALKSFSDYDQEVLARLDDALISAQKYEPNPTLFGAMALRAGKVLCELRLRNSYREQRLVDICAIPEIGRSMFRLPNDELQELWQSTLILTAKYSDLIRAELCGIADTSPAEFREELMLVANKLADGFWTNAGGARVDKDAEIAASHILSLVFGGEMMLEPMEEVDEKLMLIPRDSPEDDHLDFFGLHQAGPDHVFIDQEKGDGKRLAQPDIGDDYDFEEEKIVG